MFIHATRQHFEYSSRLDDLTVVHQGEPVGDIGKGVDVVGHEEIETAEIGSWPTTMGTPSPMHGRWPVAGRCPPKAG